MHSSLENTVSRLASVATCGLALTAVVVAAPTPVAAATPSQPTSVRARVSDPEAAFARMLAARDDAQRWARAEAFLRDHGDDAPVTWQATAHALLGAALWRASCPGAADGLCVEVVTAAPDAGTCVPALRERLVPRARNARLAQEAHDHLEQASWLADVPPPADPDEANAFRDAIAESLVLLADHDLEELLGLTPPAGPYTLTPDSSAQPALQGYLMQLMTQTGAIIAAYADVKATGSSHWVLVAAARTGFAMETPAEALGTFPLPTGMSDDTETQYCEELAANLDMMRSRAQEVYEWCIDRADTYDLDGFAVQTCRERLDVLEAAQ